MEFENKLEATSSAKCKQKRTINLNFEKNCWDRLAKHHLDDIYGYIAKDSVPAPAE